VPCVCVCLRERERERNIPSLESKQQARGVTWLETFMNEQFLALAYLKMNCF